MQSSRSVPSRAKRSFSSTRLDAVLRVRLGLNAVQIQRVEAPLQQSTGGFRGEALAPYRVIEAVAHLRAAIVGIPFEQTAPADEDRRMPGQLLLESGWRLVLQIRIDEILADSGGRCAESLGKHPELAFWIERAVHAIAPQPVGRFFEHLGTGLSGALEVLFDILDEDIGACMQGPKRVCALDHTQAAAAGMPKHDQPVAVRQLRMCKSARRVGAREDEPEAECFLHEMSRAFDVFVEEIWGQARCGRHGLIR
jgi:hypothetical protein